MFLSILPEERTRVNYTMVPAPSEVEPDTDNTINCKIPNGLPHGQQIKLLKTTCKKTRECKAGKVTQIQQMTRGSPVQCEID